MLKRKLIGQVLKRPLWLIKYRDNSYGVFFTIPVERLNEVYNLFKGSNIYFMKTYKYGTYGRGKYQSTYQYYKIYLSTEQFKTPFAGSFNAVRDLLKRLQSFNLLSRKYSDVELIMLLGEF